MLSSLGAGQRSLVLWLELTKEPTEHILNEMCEKNELFNKLTNPIYFVIQNGADYARDHTLLKTCGKVSRAELLFHDFGTEYEAISRQPGKTASGHDYEREGLPFCRFRIQCGHGGYAFTYFVIRNR